MMVVRKSHAPNRGLDRQAMKFSAAQVAQYYRQSVVADIEKYFDFLQLEKRVSLNTLVGYRKCLYLVLGYLNSAHARSSDNLTFAGITTQESGLLELSSLLGKRRNSSKKALDSHAVAQIAQDIAQAATTSAKNLEKQSVQSNDNALATTGKIPATQPTKYTFAEWNGFTWEGVSANQLQEVLQLAYLDGRSAASRNQLVAVIRSFWNWLLRTYELPNNPASTLGTIKIVKQYKAPVQSSDIERMIKQIEIEDFRDLRDHVMLQLMHVTGLRVSELCNLKLQDLNFAAEFISVVGKGKVHRKVPLNQVTIELLALYICMRELEIWNKLTSSWRVVVATVESNTQNVTGSKTSKNWYAGQELELLEILGMDLADEPFVDLTNVDAVQQYAEQVITRAVHYSQQHGGRGERGVQHFQLDISSYLAAENPALTTAMDDASEIVSGNGLTASTLASSEAEALGMLSLSALLGGGKRAMKQSATAQKSQGGAAEYNVAQDHDLQVQESKVVANTTIAQSNSSEVELYVTEASLALNTPTNYQLQKIELEKAGLKLVAHPLHALFLSSHLKGITPRAVQYRLDQRAREAGILRNLSPHKLRHSFATRFFQATANIRVVQTVLGHKNLGTTTIYTNPDQEYLHKVYNQAHPSQIEYFELLQEDRRDESPNRTRFSQWRKMAQHSLENSDVDKPVDLVVLSHAQLEAESFVTDVAHQDMVTQSVAEVTTPSAIPQEHVSHQQVNDAQDVLDLDNQAEASTHNLEVDAQT